MRLPFFSTLLIFITTFALTATAVGQDMSQQHADSEPPSARLMFGAIGAVTINIHRGVFTTYDGILECGTFENSTTVGWQAGNILDIPLGGPLSLSTRLYYHNANGNFTAPNPNPPNIALDDGTLVRLQTEHVLTTSLDYIMVDLLGKLNFMRALYFAVGPSVGISTRAAFEQEERIVSPNGITFTNGQSARTIAAGNFDEQGTQNADRSLRIGATGALGADIPVSSRFVLNPEVGFTLPFTNVLSTFDWKVSAARAGVALKYMFGGETTVIREDVPPETPRAPLPIVAVEAQNQLDDGTRLNYAEVTIVEDRLSDVMPLLPYIFFDANSHELAPRYARLQSSAASGFREESLRDSVLGIYYNVLNIIGERMVRYADAKITVTGCREPLDDTSSVGVAALRAQMVKDYLTQTWGINPNRISAAARVLPQVISNRTIDDGRQENRRVELSSSDVRILAPVQRSTNKSVVEPAAIAIVPRIQFGDSIRNWSVKISGSKGNELWSQSGTGVPARDVVWSVDKQKVMNDGAATAKSGHLTAALTTEVNGRAPIEAQREIPVRRIMRSTRISGEILNDSLLERYALMFFDFDTPNISDFNEQVVKLIQARMRTNSAVRITGLTDRIGEDSHNLALSTRRAEASSQLIRSRIIPEVLSTNGAGEMLIYNNNLPEGRFYNRTVIIEIATPVE